MSRRAAVLAVLAAALGGAQAEEEAGRGLKLSGYYKNLLARSETVLAGRERYTVDINRLRLELRGKPAENVALDLQYDNEVLLGSYLHSGQFAMQKDQPPDQYWNAEANYAEAGSYYGRHRLYRASVTLSSGDTDLRLGRQRIAWGTGRFWSALDLLNPFSPIALEREERVGVDAALLERKFGPLSRLSAVYAPRHERKESTRALSWHANAGGVDYSLVAGRFRREDVVGADIATQIGTTGIRAELTRNARETGPAYQRAVLAADHAFANTLTLSGELYYNGAGAGERTAYDFASLFAGRIQNVGRRYFGGFLSYEITPLVKWSNFLVVNLADRSRFYSPGLRLSLQANLDLTLGVQLFGGSQDSEYQRFNDLYYAQLQWFY